MTDNPDPQAARAPGSVRRSRFAGLSAWLKGGGIVWLLLPVLLWWALKDIPYQAVLQSLGQLQVWQVVVLLGLNLAIFLLISSRWWLILRSSNHKIPFWHLAAYRLTGFSLSYFTPGPQVGGEPLQVLLLARRHSIPTAVAISSVFLDKLVELLTNFAFLVLGLLVISAAGLATGRVPAWALPLVVFILLSMAGHVLLLWQGKTPFTWLIWHLAQKMPNLRRVQSISLGIQQAETEMMFLCHSRPSFLFQTLGISLLVWVGLLWEYGLMLQFIGLALNLAQVILALTLARLAFLVPLPGGLGALEASQVLAMQLLGVNPALGISLCLMIRARDLFLGSAGLGLWVWAARSEWR